MTAPFQGFNYIVVWRHTGAPLPLCFNESNNFLPGWNKIKADPKKFLILGFVLLMFSLHEFVDWLVHSDHQSAKHETGDAPPFLQVHCRADTSKYLVVEIMKMRLNILKKSFTPIMTLKEELILWIWSAKNMIVENKRSFFLKKYEDSMVWPSRMTKWPTHSPKEENAYNTWSNWLLQLQLWWWQTFDNPLNINFLAICWTSVSFYRIR